MLFVPNGFCLCLMFFFFFAVVAKVRDVIEPVVMTQIVTKAKEIGMFLSLK